MPPSTKALLVASPPLCGLLLQLWRHRVAVVDRCADVVIWVLARRDDKAPDW